MDCRNCGAHARWLRCPDRDTRRARFETLVPGARLALQRCPACGALWVCGRHEPRGTQRFWTLWPYDAAAWGRLRALPDGEALLGEWHDALLRESWLDLPGKERALVERWRERTKRERNPIDRREPAIFIARSTEIARYVQVESSRAA
jgi:hypothetical protein